MTRPTPENIQKVLNAAYQKLQNPEPLQMLCVLTLDKQSGNCMWFDINDIEKYKNKRVITMIYMDIEDYKEIQLTQAGND